MYNCQLLCQAPCGDKLTQARRRLEMAAFTGYPKQAVC